MDEYYRTSQDFSNVEKAKDLAEVLNVALDILYRMPEPIVLVAGPISTGGKGSISENITELQKTIDFVRKSGQTVFNQIMFEGRFGELAIKSRMAYFQPVLDEVYLPIFKSGKISRIYFSLGWETSTGSKWEYDIAGRLGIERIIMSGDIE